MSDFVAEIRSRRCTPPKNIPTSAHGDFVSEIRSYRQDSSDMRHPVNNCHVNGFSEQELENILSERFCSRERIARLVEGSVITLIQTLLTGRSLSKVAGCLNISLSSNESPIVLNFNQTFQNLQRNRNDDTDKDLDGCINVKLKDTDMGLSYCPSKHESFHAFSNLYEYDREPCQAISENNKTSHCSSEYQRDNLKPFPAHKQNGFSLSEPLIEAVTADDTQEQCLDPKTVLRNTRRRESDDESGYTSNEKEDPDTPGQHTPLPDSSHSPSNLSAFNDYFCSGFDGKNTLYKSHEKRNPCFDRNYNHPTVALRGHDNEVDDDDEDMRDDGEFNDKLVIDENIDEDMESICVDQICKRATTLRKEYRTESMEIDKSDSKLTNAMEEGGENTGHRSLDRSERYLNDDTEDTDSPISSDTNDTDALVETSGDSKSTLDHVSAISDPHSLVSKHPEGFRCKICSHILLDAAAVSQHVQSEHDLFCCNFCSRTFTAKNNLKRHIRIHTGQRPYKCNQCSQSFARRDELKGHMLRHDYNKPFRCSLCQKGYTDRACVKNHMVKEHRSHLMHVCPQCGESFDQEETFAAHKKTHPELQQFSCGTCSFIGTNNLMTLKHSLVHRHKLFSCKHCNAYFADPFDYTNHVRKHKKVASFTSYTCCFCDASLSTYDQYIRHEYSHAQGKTYTCKTCKKLFKSKSLLQDHAITHQQSEPDKAQTEQINSESLENSESYFMFWQPEEDQKQTCGSSRMDSRLSEDSNNRSCNFSSSTSTHMKCSPPQVICTPTHVNHTPNHMTRALTPHYNDHNDYHGELLDLSMKKFVNTNVTSSDQCDIPCNNSRNMAKDASTKLPTIPRTLGLEEHNDPRNGVVSPEFYRLAHAHERKKHSFNEIHRSESSNGEVETCNLISRVQVNIKTPTCPSNVFSNEGSSLKTVTDYERNWHETLIYPSRTMQNSDKTILTDSPPKHAKHESRTMNRLSSQENCRKNLLRFSPYSREILADLAAKFVAARGPTIFQQIPKSVVKASEHKNEIVLRGITDCPKTEAVLSPSIWQLTSTANDLTAFKDTPLHLHTPISMESSKITFQTKKMNFEISREESNPETASIYHVSDVVKTEPLLEIEAAGKHGFQNSAANGVNITTGEMNTTQKDLVTSYVCDDCREYFGSFSELESHSVEIHKRYLCEHCKKSFTARPNRDRHVRYHTGERPYKCDLCDFAFFRGDDLKYHRTTRHPTAQPFECTRCLATFTWSRDLDRHMRHSKCRP